MKHDIVIVLFGGRLMEPRLRAGLIAGGGAAISTLLLSLAFTAFCGPLIAIIGGLSAGMQIARDPRFARNATGAAAIAGVYAGLIVGVAQIIGMALSLATPTGQQAIAQVITQYPVYTTTTVWIVLIIFAVVLAILDVGIMAGCAAIIARNLTRATANSPTRYATPRAGANAYYVPMTGTPQPLPPVMPSYGPPPVPVKTYPPPPPYPPPPSYYGFPDIAVPEAPVAPPTPPANAETE